MGNNSVVKIDELYDVVGIIWSEVGYNEFYSKDIISYPIRRALRRMEEKHLIDRGPKNKKGNYSWKLRKTGRVPRIIAGESVFCR